MRRLFVALCAVGLGVSLSAFAAPTGMVPVTGGIVRGEMLDNGEALFRGIPFAAPPLGSLRWRPPAPVVSWQGVRETVQSAPACLQASFGWNDADAARSSEDCLYLDVRVPVHAAAAKLPVMVWIHGGANRAGSAAGYTSSTITTKGVILVALQYRMDVFGFLSLPALSAESPVHISGNYGLLDQIAALQWVKENIAQFGGDPANVTIFGKSAGAQDVGLLMLSPLARGLFHRAIEQSGTAGFGVPPRTLAENEALGADFAGKAGATGPDALQRLRALPGQDLLAASSKLVPPAIADASFIWLQAVIDGWVLPDRPAKLLSAGAQASVPLLIGTNAQEFSLHGGPDAFGTVVRQEFGIWKKRALAYYRRDDGAGLGDIPTRLAADLTFRCPSAFVANAQVKVGKDVWSYLFDRVPPGHAGPVFHGADLPFVFGDLPVGVTTDGAPLTLQRYWANFARTGNPNGPGLPVWPRYAPDKAYLAFTEEGPKPGRNLRGPLCDMLPRP